MCAHDRNGQKFEQYRMCSDQIYEHCMFIIMDYVCVLYTIIELSWRKQQLYAHSSNMIQFIRMYRISVTICWLGRLFEESQMVYIYSSIVIHCTQQQYWAILEFNWILNRFDTKNGHLSFQFCQLHKTKCVV